MIYKLAAMIGRAVKLARLGYRDGFEGQGKPKPRELFQCPDCEWTNDHHPACSHGWRNKT